MPEGHSNDIAAEARLTQATSTRFGRLTTRTWAWTLFIVFAAAYYLVLMSSLGTVAKLIPLEIIYCTPIVLTVVLSTRARAITAGVERTFWTMLGAANFVLLLCEVLLTVWVVFISLAGPPRVSWPFHILHGMAAVFFITMLVAMNRVSQASSSGKLIATMDIAAVSLMVGVLALQLYVRPAMGPEAPFAHVVLGTGYALFGLLMLLGTLSLVVGFKIDKWRTWDRLIAGSLAVYSLAVFLWPAWYTTAAAGSRNFERGVLDLVQFAGHWVLMMGVVYRLTEPDVAELRPLPPVVPKGRGWISVVVPVLALFAIPTIVLVALGSAAEPQWSLFFGGVATALTAIVLGRSILVSLENGVLFRHSVTDPLTGLYNHRYLFTRLADELTRASRFGDELALIVMDVDRFGRFNQSQGHAEGDRLLADIGSVIGATGERGWVAARLGGDEFAVIVPETDLMEATVAARRLVDAVAIRAGARPGTVSVSVGVGLYPLHATDCEGLVRVAEGALFHAKSSGGAHVVVFDDHRVPDLSAEDRMERLEAEGRLAAVAALTAAIDARGGAAGSHAHTVSALSAAVAGRLGLGEEEVRSIELAALLHDIGKIAQPDGAATTEVAREDSTLREQSIAGQQILSAAGLGELQAAVRSRHERWDGTGLPDGLAGREIPLSARVLAVCDTYESLVADGPGRLGLTRERALAAIEADSGTRFDPGVVETLRDVLGTGR